MHVSGCCSFGYVNGCLLQSCHDTGCHIATKCVVNDGLCEVKRCQSGVDHLQACKHVCKQVSNRSRLLFRLSAPARLANQADDLHMWLKMTL